jgi:hypothetical protein
MRQGSDRRINIEEGIGVSLSHVGPGDWVL